MLKLKVCTSSVLICSRILVFSDGHEAISSTDTSQFRNIQKTACRWCFARVDGIGKVRHRKHFISAALIGQSASLCKSVKDVAPHKPLAYLCPARLRSVAQGHQKGERKGSLLYPKVSRETSYAVESTAPAPARGIRGEVNKHATLKIEVRKLSPLPRGVGDKKQT